MEWGNFISAVIGGVIVLASEHLFLSYKERTKEKRLQRITFPQSERVIDDSIFSHLRHGASIELMRNVLGSPKKVSKYDEPIFLISHWETGLDGDDAVASNYEEGLGRKTNSYLYEFKNADVKITSKDNETIDSLTVIAKDKSLGLGTLVFPWGEDENPHFNEVKVDMEMVSACRPEHLQTRWDNVLVLSLYVGSPSYDYATFFGYTEYKKGIEVNSENPENFIGGIITGVCLSQNDTDAYYIYFRETT